MKRAALSHKQPIIYFLLLPLLFLLTGNAQAQLEDPVKWSWSGEMTGKNTAQLKFSATIEDGWYLYSQLIEDGGPIKTAFYFNDLTGFEFIDEDVEIIEEESFMGDGSKIYKVIFSESESVEKYDPNFEMDLRLISDYAEFTRDIRITTAQPLEITGFLEFMCCDNEKCLPPAEIEFAFSFQVDEPAQPAESAVIPETGADDFEADDATSESVWYMFIVGFLGGLLALLTPCVFPMIPMTVSFFLRGSDSKAKGKRDALFYGISIIITDLWRRSVKPDGHQSDFQYIFLRVVAHFCCCLFRCFRVAIALKLDQCHGQQSRKVRWIDWCFPNGICAGTGFVFLHRPHHRNAVGSGRRYRKLVVAGNRHGRLFHGARHSVYLTCFLPFHARINAKIRRLAQFGKGSTCIYPGSIFTKVFIHG